MSEGMTGPMTAREIEYAGAMLRVGSWHDFAVKYGARLIADRCAFERLTVQYEDLRQQYERQRVALEKCRVMFLSIYVQPGYEKDCAEMARLCSEALAPSEPSSTKPALLQPRIREWLLACFGPEIAADKTERAYRFVEEALELAQAIGVTSDDVRKLVDYVFGRPVGEARQEVGGVMLTLAALCGAIEIDMNDSGEAELARVWRKIEVIREKQRTKPHGSPLPGAIRPSSPKKEE